MRARPFPVFTLIILALIAATPRMAMGDDKESPVRIGTKLLIEGDRLADQGQLTEAVVRYKRGFEKILPELRKIPFLHEVKRDVTKRENLKALLLKELDEDMTPEEFRANEMAMKAFGLLPRDFNLKETLAQVYSEEVAAFYDPENQDDAPDRGAQEAGIEEVALLPGAALRQERGVRQGREQDRHRPRADPCPGRSAL